MDGVSFGFLAEMYIRYSFFSCKKVLATEESKQLVCRLSRDFQMVEYQLYTATAFLFHAVCTVISDGHSAFLRGTPSCMRQLVLIEHILAASEAHCATTVNRGMNEAVKGVKGFLCKPDGASTNPVWAFDALTCLIKSENGRRDPPYHLLSLLLSRSLSCENHVPSRTRRKQNSENAYGRWNLPTTLFLRYQTSNYVNRGTP